MLNKKIKDKFSIYYLLLVLVFLAGFIIRLKLLLLNPDLYKDEANLALNITNSGYLNLFNPLKNHQVAPPFFLILSKFVYNIYYLHPTPYFSDMVLRFIPFLSGVLAIPAIGIMLNMMFKNRFINLMGMYLVSINTLAISYSVIFKQYSTEMFVTILAIILIMKTDLNDGFKKNGLKFLMLGLLPYISLSSFFLLPASFLYLLVKAFKSKTVKKFMLLSLITVVCLLVYYFVFLKGVTNSHFDYMVGFWLKTNAKVQTLMKFMKVSVYRIFGLQAYFPRFVFHLYKPLAFLLFLIMIRKFPTSLLISIPILCCFIVVKNQCYPMSARFLLFFLPIYTALALYPFSEIPQKAYKYIKFFLPILFFLLLFLFIGSADSMSKYIYKKEDGRKIWTHFVEIYDGKTPVIISSSLNTQNYYSRLFHVNNCIPVNKNQENIYLNLPKGRYYYVSSVQDEITQFIYKNITEKQEVIDILKIEVPFNKDFSKAVYIEFNKLN